MLILKDTDVLQLVTEQAVAVDVHASFVDWDGTNATPGRTDTLISTATTTTVVGSPASGQFRTVKTLTVRNRDASASVTVVVRHSDGTVVSQLHRETLLGDTALVWAEGVGWQVVPFATSAHALLSSRHTDAAPGAVQAGDIIVGDATPAWARLAKGATDYVLKAGATLVDWGQVVTASIADGAVTIAKLASAVLDRMFTSLAKRDAVEALESGGNVATDKVVTASIAAGAVTDAKLRDSAAASVIGRSAATSGAPSDIAATAAGQLLRRTGTTLAWVLLTRTAVLVVPGADTTTGIRSIRLIMPVAGTITAVRSTSRKAVTSGTWTFDINKNGTTIYTTQSNRPTRVSGDGTGAKTHTLPNVTSLSAGDILDVDVDGAGTGGEDFAFFIEFTEVA